MLRPKWRLDFQEGFRQRRRLKPRQVMSCHVMSCQSKAKQSKAKQGKARQGKDNASPANAACAERSRQQASRRVKNRRWRLWLHVNLRQRMRPHLLQRLRYHSRRRRQKLEQMVIPCPKLEHRICAGRLRLRFELSMALACSSAALTLFPEEAASDPFALISLC